LRLSISYIVSVDQHVIILVEQGKPGFTILSYQSTLRVAKLKDKELFDNLTMEKLVMSLGRIMLVGEHSTKVLCSYLLQITVYLLLLIRAIFLR
jgi:uncharacterized membrane protein